MKNQRNGFLEVEVERDHGHGEDSLLLAWAKLGIDGRLPCIGTGAVYWKSLAAKELIAGKPLLDVPILKPSLCLALVYRKICKINTAMEGKSSHFPDDRERSVLQAFRQWCCVMKQLVQRSHVLSSS